jgi:hypothetical protein
MPDWRLVERAIERFMRSNKIALSDDGLGCLHFVIAKEVPSREIPFAGKGGLSTSCPLEAQTGLSCYFIHERVRLDELAKAIVAEMADA